MPINKEVNRPVEVKVHEDVWVAAKDRARRSAQNLSAICKAIMLRPNPGEMVEDPQVRREHEERRRIRFIASKEDVITARWRCDRAGTTLSQVIEAGLERYVISGDIDKPVVRKSAKADV